MQLSCQKSGLWKKSVSMILRLYIRLLVASYGRKNIFYEMNSKLTNNNYFNDLFCNLIFPYYRLLPIFKILLNLMFPMSSRPAIEGPGLESQRSRKRHFSTERFSNSLNILKESFQ